MLLGLPFRAQIGRIPTDVCFSARVFEIDLCLVKRRTEKVVGPQLHADTSWRTDAQPIKSERVAAGNPVVRSKRKEFCQRQFLSPVQKVALVFGNNEGKARDFGREVA